MHVSRAKGGDRGAAAEYRGNAEGQSGGKLGGKKKGKETGKGKYSQDERE